MTLPNFYIAGTQKGGTTSLHHLVASHSAVYFPNFPQELHYFDIEENFNKGLTWFESFFKNTDNSVTAIGQTSPFYMYHPEVPKRIKSLTPDAKFIFILRNPITRAYSHYWNSVRYGFEPLSFEKALNAERTRLLNGGEYSLRHHSYVDRGFYHQQIRRFEELFGRTALLVLTQDELISDLESIQNKCANFLNVNMSGFDNRKLTTSIHNPSRLPRIKSIQRIRPWLERKGLKQTARLLDKTNLQVRNYPKMESTSLMQLQNIYSAEIEAIKLCYLPTLQLQEMWS